MRNGLEFSWNKVEREYVDDLTQRLNLVVIKVRELDLWNIMVMPPLVRWQIVCLLPLPCSSHGLTHLPFHLRPWLIQ